VARLAPYDVEIVRDLSVQAAMRFMPGELDWIYIDSNHDLPHVIADLNAWVPKVRPGGIIAGHDYVRYPLANRVHVIEAVRAWTNAYEIRPWFVLGSQAKVKGEIRDSARSWMWVQPEPRPRSSERIRQ
jgi:hypothetical protein